ncbi:DUF6973 domain-containing protein [Salinimicrobium sp. TH3]|uniref:DUF6973 domain-containing protein n=1 Tax=Salinimicrobium sp. TH3 TaxID=2997342 RepID=UPI0022757B86|nr:hypothetical protein [Salinimicrobium sp. TH3]MCY2686615.1 hypothetical protein [Salinimicrobium sp. TH3]
MVVGKRIATLNFRELVILCAVFLRHPLYLLPIYKATREAVAISDRLYGDLHHKDNRTNAFRHALWNYLICKSCLPAAGSPENTLSWSKKITDLHERLSPNESLAKKMDLHNNRIGRELFMDLVEKEKEEVIYILQKKTGEAIKIESVEEIEKEKNNLVFLEKLKTSK